MKYMRPDIKCSICNEISKWTREDLEIKTKFYFLCKNGHRILQTEFF